jgi:hypothetical protein
MMAPIRLTRSARCARAAIGHAAAPPSSVMNSRRFTGITVGTAKRCIRYGKAERLRGL